MELFLDTSNEWLDEFAGQSVFDAMADRFSFLDERYAAASADEADQPQFDILYQLRQMLDPRGTRGIQEANITDGRGRPVYGARASVGPRVDLHYRTGSGTRMNLEVDLDPREQQRHRDEHLAAMRLAYNRWVQGGRRGPNPLTGVASIFASARRPTRRGRVGRITGVERVQYHAGRDGIVRPVTTGRARLPADGVLPQAVARQHQGIFTTVVRTLPAGRPVRSRRVPPQRRRFDAFLDTVA